MLGGPCHKPESVPGPFASITVSPVARRLDFIIVMMVVFNAVFALYIMVGRPSSKSPAAPVSFAGVLPDSGSPAVARPPPGRVLRGDSAATTPPAPAPGADKRPAVQHSQPAVKAQAAAVAAPVTTSAEPAALAAAVAAAAAAGEAHPRHILHESWEAWVRGGRVHGTPTSAAAVAAGGSTVRRTPSREAGSALSP